MSSGGGGAAGDIFDVKRVRRLVELMIEHELTEVDLRQGEQRIRLRKGHEPVITMAPAASMPAREAAPRDSGGAAAAPASDAGLVVIKSPMVGTFYASASPENPPFVKVGDHVGPTTTVCLIEAMKVFNEIPAEVSGQIVAVLVENGAAVEFNQPLFNVDPRK